MASMMTRMDKCVPLLKALVQQHNEGTYAGGVEAFNAEIEGVLEQHGMFSDEYLQVDQVGVHPHNREKTMLVPMDCQDLLAKFYENGYNPKKWEALALKIPSIGFGAQEAAQEWRSKNVELVQGSDGLLAPMASPELIDRFTGRGSHGTGALRLAKFGGKCVHPELQGSDGQVSLSKLLEKQPSWKGPIEKGLLYRCLPGELELAVPGLLACLSRGGNASHDVYRQQTVLQTCNRLHLLCVTAGTDFDEDWVCAQACLGNGGSAFMPKARQLLEFVKAWAGGNSAHILKDLEIYERSCPHKRKLMAADMEGLAQADLLHAPKYVGVSWFFYIIHGSFKMFELRIARDLMASYLRRPQTKQLAYMVASCVCSQHVMQATL